MMSLGEYLHEKAEESRHDETIGYLMMITGSIFWLNSTLMTAITESNPNWLLFL